LKRGLRLRYTIESTLGQPGRAGRKALRCCLQSGMTLCGGKCLLWVICRHVGLHEKASAFLLKADILRAAEIVSYVPLADIRPYVGVRSLAA
jgi:hypothetical protein